MTSFHCVSILALQIKLFFAGLVQGFGNQLSDIQFLWIIQKLIWKSKINNIDETDEILFLFIYDLRKQKEQLVITLKKLSKMFIVRSLIKPHTLNHTFSIKIDIIQ